MKRYPDWVLARRKAGFDPYGKRLKSPSYKPRRRPSRTPVAELAALHRKQKGVCANPGCRVPVEMRGKKQAHDPPTGAILCKACSIALGNLQRSPRKIVGLLAYLGYLDIKLLEQA